MKVFDKINKWFDYMRVECWTVNLSSLTFAGWCVYIVTFPLLLLDLVINLKKYLLLYANNKFVQEALFTQNDIQTKIQDLKDKFINNKNNK